MDYGLSYHLAVCCLDGGTFATKDAARVRNVRTVYFVITPGHLHAFAWEEQVPGTVSACGGGYGAGLVTAALRRTAKRGVGQWLWQCTD
jgi:hypothetical protein